jgi:ATP-dependent Clp protease adaptor protein ClpS
LPDVETSVREALAAGWTVVVWNDPINLMSYVVYVFQRVLKMDHQTASRHMLEVHHRGKSVVAKENREKAELFVHQLQAYGLHATLEAA